MYSQDIPDNYLGIDVPTLTAQYRANGVGDEIIEYYINQLREKETKRFLEVVKYEKALEERLKLKKSTLNTTNDISISKTDVKISARRLGVLVEENQIVNSGVNTKFFIEPTSPGMTYEWLFYGLDNVTVKDSATTPIAYQKYTAPGVYRITVEVKDVSGCISYYTKNIEVKDSGLCVRKPIDFAFETESTDLKYTWSATNAAGVVVNEVLNNKTGLYTYTPTLPGDYVIKLTATGTGKCETLFEEKITVIDCDPTLPICENHTVIVLDESGSIDDTEAKRIRAQLKSFISAQIKSNKDGEGKMTLSLIGLSDTDENTRTDHVIEHLVTEGDLLSGGYIFNWIEGYGRRYGNTGVSAGSDYWKSGLSVALNSNFKIKPKLVFLITDGCQTTNPEGLRTLMQKFDNYQDSPDKSEDKPHLYVVGINNGFYVDNAVTSQAKARSEDPNFVPSLLKTGFDSTNSAYLGKSLQYLFNFKNDNSNAFPIERINGFDSATYFAHNDFTILSDEPFYFSDGIIEAGVGCGKPSEKDYCANCLSFQPEINKEYLLSAWVKEETNIQVKNYENSEINIVFYNNPEAADADASDPDAPSQIIGSITLKPTGAIIDGWQRISGKFIVPENTITAGVVLNNKNVGIPIYFDDLRIHPMDGSVKTFVYDSETFKLMSELDENNYSTFYEYDNEGGLVRVKKETSQGVKTIQETRSGNFINPK